MAKIYYKQILSGKITIEKVPSRWKNEVLRLLDNTNMEAK